MNTHIIDTITYNKLFTRTSLLTGILIIKDVQKSLSDEFRGFIFD